MRSVKYIIISCTLLAVVLPTASACWHPNYRPSEYYVFYIDEKKYEYDDYYRLRLSYKPNVADWIAYTQVYDLNAEDVEEVVYRYSLSELEQIEQGDTIYCAGNTFARYLVEKKDQEAIHYLMLAKKCELARSRRNDPWWYPSKEEMEYEDMKSILREALAYEGQSLKARYLLQAVRAAYTMQDYDLCLQLWEEQISPLPRSTVRSLCEDYIGGICYKRGDYEKALEHYAQVVDVSNSFWWYVKHNSASDLEQIETLYRYAPSSPDLPGMVEKICREAEERANIMVFDGEDPMEEYDGTDDNYGYNGYRKNRERYLHLRDFALKVVEENRTDNPAMWQYTASFLTMLDGDTALASQYIRRAGGLKGTGFIKNNIKVLDIMIDALHDSYNATFEARILPKLKWLDQMITDNLEENIKTRYNEYSDYSSIFTNYSQYYYSDMMRKIALSVMSPRYQQKGETIKAMMLTGMASERMRIATDYRKVQPSVGDKHYWNSDFYTDIFIMMDTLSVEDVVAYSSRLYRGKKSAFERFLSDRCYKNSDYFNEIIGTKYMRVERFDKAAEYLTKVSQGYDATLNIYTYFRYDPFKDVFFRFPSEEPIDNYKLDFANYMLDLQKIIRETRSNELRANASYQYGLGMQQALTNCWALFRYKVGSAYNLGADNFDTWSKPLFKSLDEHVVNAIQLTQYESFYGWTLMQCDRFSSYVERG